MIEQLSKLRKSLLFIAAVLLASLHMTATNRDSLALTPPMGFMTWNKYKEDINEQLIRQIADKMAADGYAEAGYKYIFIDDAWQGGRDKRNNIIPDPKKFPSGIKALADYVHSKGLLLGIYSDAAQLTCAGYTASYDFEEQDAKTFAEWGIDYLKYDYCHAPGDAATAQVRYKAMGDALKASSRDILLYMCEWGAREPWKWGSTTGSPVWRATYDTRDGWNGVQGGIGIIQSIAAMKDLWPYSGVNRFNDADMMCVGIHGTGKSSNDLVAGKPGMTQDEYRTQFALWCMWSSPLLLSFDLTKPITADDKKLMTNADLIALDQDDLGQQAEYIGTTDNMVYFMKDLANGDVAIFHCGVANGQAAFFGQADVVVQRVGKLLTILSQVHVFTCDEFHFFACFHLFGRCTCRYPTVCRT